MQLCVICGDVKDSQLFKCENCTLTTCAVCAERQINTGNLECSCGTDVVEAMKEFYSDPLVKQLNALSLNRQVTSVVDERVATEVALFEAEHRRKEAQRSDLNDEALRLADDFQQSIMDACPSCKFRFNDFSGCVALTCTSCKTNFCALCLHVGSCATHGHISGHLYADARAVRVDEKFDAFFSSRFAKEGIESRMFRLFAARLAAIDVRPKQLSMMNTEAGGGLPTPVNVFIRDCQTQLTARVEEERQAIVGVSNSVRPDCAVPEGYTVVLNRSSGVYWAKFEVEVEKQPTQLFNMQDLPRTEETQILRSIYTAVVVCDGRVYQTRNDSGGGCLVYKVRDGKMDRDPEDFRESFVVSAICGNRRMIDSLDYLSTLTPELVCVPVLAIIGAVENKLLTPELRCDVLPSADDLNLYQAKVVDMTRLRSSQVIIGPPGTGKSRTIVALILQLLAEMPRNHVIILTSEKNGAIEAVAEHLQRACKTGKEFKDLSFFEKVTAFGSTAMKDATRAFTHDAKMKALPENMAASHKELVANFARMRAVASCKEVLSPVEDFIYQHTLLSDAYVLIRRHADTASIDFKAFQSKMTFAVGESESGAANEKVRTAIKKLTPALIELEVAEEALLKAKEEKETTKLETDTRLRSGTRLMLATIGSLHQVHTAVSPNDREGDNVENTTAFGAGLAEDNAGLIYHYIIDEASTVPQFEICTLGQIGNVVSLTIVGDPQQLKPFSPVKRQNSAGTTQPEVVVTSIFNVNRVDCLHLELQYRVPRLIANEIDKAIYKGRYKSHESVAFNPFPFVIVEVASTRNEEVFVHRGRGGRGGRGGGGRGGLGGRGDDDRDRECYRNSAEAIIALRLLQKYGFKDYLLLTPYRDQIKEIKRQFAKENFAFDENKVITVDQSQGQEADIVIISLTNSRPTKFLDTNRLNVMFSRAKKCVILLTDLTVLRPYCESPDNRKRLAIVTGLLSRGTTDLETAEDYW